MNTNLRESQGHHRDRAFTLLELLVVVSIIVVLIALLLPALRSAREQSRIAACQSNLKQIGVAWWAYLNDNAETFPLPRHNLDMAWAYGGRHPSLHITKYQLQERPLNPYLDQRKHDDPATAIFQCPSDRPVVQRITGDQGTQGHTTFEYFGNSYRANVSLFRLDIPPIPSHPLYYLKSRPVGLDEVDFPYSMVVLAGDPRFGFAYGPWDADMHNDYGQTPLVFLDGHVAYLQIVPGPGATAPMTTSLNDRRSQR